MMHKARPSILGGLVCIVAAFVVFAFVTYLGWDCRRVASFASTMGKIREKNVGSKTSGNGRVYFPVLVYVYKVGEIEHAGSNYAYFGVSGSESWAKTIVDQTEVGSACKVYYNPKKPLESTLNPQPNTFMIVVGLGLLGLALAVVVAGIQQIVIGMYRPGG
jgi:hypothetical protein